MNGVFPDILKIANVVPLFKKEDLMLFSNYKPVSLLCTLSKVLEKIMYNRVIEFFMNMKYSSSISSAFGKAIQLI